MERAFLLQRGVIDLESGRFPVTLFTNGEASDGHIIDVRGLQVPDRVPMFFNHDADPTRRAGGLVDPKKVGKSTQLGRASLKMVAVLDVAGDSAAADIRRDVAQGISVGDITAMSGRWDPVGDPTPRAALPKSHYAFSNVSGGFSTPMFFPEATVLEGSIVGVGADAAALIGRAMDAGRPQHVRDFYAELTAGETDPEVLSLTCRVEELEAALQVEHERSQIVLERQQLEEERAEIEEEQEELAGVQAVDVTTPEEPEPERSEPKLPEMSDGLRPEFVERMRRYIDESPKRVARRASQIAYEKMGFIDE
jgi:hypothetical protein